MTFFIDTVRSWFDLISSRSPTMALSKMNEEKYTNSMEHLNLLVEILRDLKIGEKSTQTNPKRCHTVGCISPAIA